MAWIAKGKCLTNDPKKKGKSSKPVMKEYAQFLRRIAALTLQARLASGARLLDVSDFRQWLVEMAEKAEQAEDLEQLLSRI